MRNNQYTVSGFSYGAIKALQYTLQQLEDSQRVDTLQLFSPVFFQTKEAKFKRLQLMAYKKSQRSYMQEFLKSCFHPYPLQNIKQIETSIDELKELLEYQWNLEELELIIKSGVVIEVYLGGKDSIIDAQKANEFFKQVTTTTYIKNANHFLQEEE